MTKGRLWTTWVGKGSYSIWFLTAGYIYWKLSFKDFFFNRILRIRIINFSFVWDFAWVKTNVCSSLRSYHGNECENFSPAFLEVLDSRYFIFIYFRYAGILRCENNPSARRKEWVNYSPQVLDRLFCSRIALYLPSCSPEPLQCVSLQLGSV